MLVATRLHTSQGSCSSFPFVQLSTPNRCPHKQVCEEEPILDRKEEANTTTLHNLLYHFDSFFDTPFETPRAMDNVSLTMNPKERNHDVGQSKVAL